MQTLFLPQIRRNRGEVMKFVASISNKLQNNQTAVGSDALRLIGYCFHSTTHRRKINGSRLCIRCSNANTFLVRVIFIQYVTIYVMKPCYYSLFKSCFWLKGCTMSIIKRGLYRRRSQASALLVSSPVFKAVFINN